MNPANRRATASLRRAVVAGGPVAFDAVGPTSAGATLTNGTSLSWSHTCSGTNRLLIVGVATGAPSSTANTLTTGLTYGGVAMTLVTKVLAGNANNGSAQLFYLVNPPAGTATVAVTLSGAADLSAGSTSFVGVNQTTPLGTPVSAFGNSAAASVAITGTSTSNMIVDCVAAGTSIASSGKTSRWIRNTNNLSGGGNGAQSTAASLAGSVTMSYSAGADTWGIAAVEVRTA